MIIVICMFQLETVLVTAKDPLQGTTITRLLRDVNNLHMELMVVMETDLKITKVVKKLVVHQLG